MQFRHYDSLWLFQMVARHDSFSSAADAMNLTKGAISYQIRTLEQALGFQVFKRLPRGISLTSEGRALCDTATHMFEVFESRIKTLRVSEVSTVTVGLPTYLASRWLSPRLMEFMLAFPHVRLRLQPMIDLMDLRDQGVDLAIRWGDGKWDDLEIKPLFPSPAFPTGAPDAMATIEAVGLEAALAMFTLLHDREGSDAWADWHAVAGIPYHEHSDRLIIPDPNVRVQAVIDGQGIALNDALVAQELRDGRLVRLSDCQLNDYGFFLAYEPNALNKPDVAVFADWLTTQSL